MKLDMLAVSVPVLDLQYPPSSPAVIKSCLVEAGFTCHTRDLNILLLDICGSKNKFLDVQYNFENVGPDIVHTDDLVYGFFDNNHDLIRQWLDQSVKYIEEMKPTWLGISVFSYKSHKASLLLCAELRRLQSPVKIVLGGRGATSYALGPDHSEFKSRMINFFGKYPGKNFSESLLEYKLIDKVIHGDGEQAIIDLMTKETEDNTRGNIADIDIEKIPFVDYDDYDINAYDYINDPILAITGSKGCVRKCTFCDIPVLWPKYKFRSGQHIADEMIYLQNKHGVRKFYLTDSLVNGSMKAFKDFINTLAEHNENNPNQSIRWVGQYITRPPNQGLTDQYYDLLKKSGAEGLTIGAESGSDNVRKHMKKNFKTIDLDTETAQFDRVGIVCVLLFFSCYPTETWDDFLDTVDMFIRYQKYAASGTVYKITLGTPYTHHPDTPLWVMQNSIGLTNEPGSDILWSLETNPELTYYERVRRRLILQEVSIALRMPMSRSTAELNQLRDSIKYHQKSIDRYFEPGAKIKVYTDHFDLTGKGTVLMPRFIQEQIKKQLGDNPEYIQRIERMHNNINDDIQFDNDAYTELRDMLVTCANNQQRTTHENSA